jgi:hypothetical protein
VHFGAETALHLAAKQLIVQNQGISVPGRVVNESVKMADDRSGEGEVTRPEMWLDFNTVEEEMSFGNIRPDIAATLNDTYLFIEIAVTHFVDQVKRELLDELNISAHLDSFQIGGGYLLAIYFANFYT